MPVIPNLVERFLFRHNLAPGPMLDYLGAQAFQVLATAQELGVFEVLTDGPLTTVEVAGRIAADERGTALLLQALVTLGYLSEKDGRFAPTSMTEKWLPVLGTGVACFDMLVQRFHDLGASIRRGGPAVDPREWLDREPDGWRKFQAGMIAIARLTVGEVIARVPLALAAQRLLDVGGGHGLYSIEFCHRYPQLSATVFDLPEALDSARETIARCEMEGRVSVCAGDFWIDSLGEGYDVGLLFNIVHANVPVKNVELLRKLNAALHPGALVVILDQLTGEVSGTTSRALAALSGLNLFNLAGGQAYEYEEIAGWLRSAGFGGLRCIRLRATPGFWLVVGVKLEQGGGER